MDITIPLISLDFVVCQMDEWVLRWFCPTLILTLGMLVYYPRKIGFVDFWFTAEKRKNNPTPLPIGLASPWNHGKSLLCFSCFRKSARTKHGKNGTAEKHPTLPQRFCRKAVTETCLYGTFLASTKTGSADFYFTWKNRDCRKSCYTNVPWQWKNCERRRGQLGSYDGNGAIKVFSGLDGVSNF